MFRTSLRTALLGTATLLFLMALTFSWTREPFHQVETTAGITTVPNNVAACGTLGFAMAGGLALVAAAIVDRTRQLRREPPTHRDQPLD